MVRSWGAGSVTHPPWDLTRGGGRIQVNTNGSISITFPAGQGLTLTQPSAPTNVITLDMVAGPAGDAIRVRDSGAIVRFRIHQNFIYVIDSGGTLRFAANTGTGSPPEQVYISTAGTGVKGLRIRPFNGSQTADLLEVSNASDVAIARILPSGVISAPIAPSNPDNTLQTANKIYMVTGVPNNAQGANGDFCFRTDGGVGTRLYFKTGGAWTAIL